MAELSVFVDESGDIGSQSDYYILTFVFHDQARDIGSKLHGLDERLRLSGLPGDVIHTGPLIRREDEYRLVPYETRHKLFVLLYNFVRRCDISYAAFALRKRECAGEEMLRRRLIREVVSFLRIHRDALGAFSSLIIYYDNGQETVKHVLDEAFRTVFANVEFRKAAPQDYRLLQAADMLCTFEMLRSKERDGLPMTSSEKRFFGSWRSLRKDYLKAIDKLLFA